MLGHHRQASETPNGVSVFLAFRWQTDDGNNHKSHRVTYNLRSLLPLQWKKKKKSPHQLKKKSSKLDKTFWILACMLWVVSGLPGALYSICCSRVSTILESKKIVTMWPTNDLIALTRQGSRGVGEQPPFFNKQPAGPAGDGETPVASAKCLMSLIGHLLRPVGTSPPCFSFTRFIVEQCLLKKTSI